MNRRVRLDDDSFRLLTELLHRTAGLTFDESRREAVALSVSTRMRDLGLDTTEVGTYLALLTNDESGEERQALLDEVTIPETHFFRNPPQVRALRSHVLPELLKQASESRTLRIWSAGCSTGEEPYTVAMLIRELLPDKAEWDVQILATDVSNRALAKAGQGGYGERAFVMTDPVDLARWFTLDAAAATWVVRDEVRDLVTLQHHNLVSDPPPFGPGECDLLLCRNVTIYFDRETTRALIQRLHDTLRPGGYLFLGHAETLWQINDDFELTPLGDAFVYRRPAPGEERRRVLPDRRTEEELSVLQVDRRRGRKGDRRQRADAAVNSGEMQASAIAPAQRTGEPELAVQRTLETASVPVPVPVPLIAVGSISDSEARARSAQLIDPLDAVRMALTQGRYDDARDLAEDVIVADPLRADAHYLLGVALTDLGFDGQAVTVLRRAVYLDPDGGFSHFLLAGALMRLGEALAAARCYRAAASTLGRRQGDDIAVELGGRSVAELAAACLQLAKQAEDAAGP